MLNKPRHTDEKEFFFSVMHTNDEHSSLIPHGPATEYHPCKKNFAVGGLARLASFVKIIRAEKKAAGEPFLLVSSGDIIGSNPFGWLINRGYAPELEIMQKIGYDYITVGNHELHQGTDILAGYYKTAGFPQTQSQTVILGTNLIFPENHFLSDPGLIRKTHMRELENGLRVGILGVLGYDAMEIVEQSLVSGVAFDDPVKASRKAVSELRRQGADVIVAVNHAGPEINKKIARKVEGIHIIIGGHEHIAFEEPFTEKKTIIVEAGECLRYAGLMEFAFNRKSGKIRLRNRETGRRFLTPIDNRIPADDEITPYIKKYTEKLNKLVKELTDGQIDNILRPVAQIPYDLPNTPRRKDNAAGNFVTDAMRLTAEKITGKKVDVAFQGTGLFRLPLITGKSSHALHRVSFYDLAEILEIVNGPDGEAGTPMVSFYLTGRELLFLAEICVLAGEAMSEYYSLQVSGLRFEYDPRRAYFFKLPAANLPFPAFRAVQKAEIYTGEGRQSLNDADYRPLNRKDEKLYHVVADYLITKSAIDYIHKKIPLLNIVLRDEKGVPVGDPENAIIKTGGRHYKIWQAVNDYALSQPKQPKGEDGLPQLDNYYNKKTPQRIIAVKSKSSPLPGRPVRAILPLSAALLFLLLYVRRGGSKTQEP